MTSETKLAREIVADVAVMDPLHDPDPEGEDPVVECFFCKARQSLFLSSPLVHKKTCIWDRANDLAFPPPEDMTT